LIIDTSVLVAILGDEEESLQFSFAIRNTSSRRMSAASYLETGIVIDGERKAEFSQSLDGIIRALGISIDDVTPSQASIARVAYRTFGKKSGSLAKLNFGDCLTYALAVETNEPLLFKGKDFNHTDLRIDSRSVIIA
jgi:ribonuclease VapC